MLFARPLCIAAVLLLGASSPAPAQEPAPASTHEAAARELLELIGVSQTAEAGAEAMLVMVRNNPELAPFEDVFRDWYKLVFSKGDFEGEVAVIYMKHFSENELEELSAFYRTPLGQKTLETLPVVMKEGAELGFRRAQDYSADLERMLDEARAQRAEEEDGS